MVKIDYVITLWNGSLAVIDVSKKKFKLTLIDNPFGWKISYFLLTETQNQLAYEKSRVSWLINFCKFFINLPFVYIKVVFLCLEKMENYFRKSFRVSSNDSILLIEKNLGTLELRFWSDNHHDSWILSSDLKTIEKINNESIKEQREVLKIRQLYVFVAQTILFGLITRNMGTSAIFTGILVWELKNLK